MVAGQLGFVMVGCFMFFPYTISDSKHFCLWFLHVLVSKPTRSDIS